jgi:hypothetical protein
MGAHNTLGWVHGFGLLANPKPKIINVLINVLIKKYYLII